MKVSHFLFATLAGLAAARPITDTVARMSRREQPVQYCTPDTEGQPCVFTGAANAQVIGVCSRSTKRSNVGLPVSGAEGVVGDAVQTVGSQCEPTYVNEVAVEDDVDDTLNTTDDIVGVTDVRRRQVPIGGCSKQTQGQTCIISRASDSTVTGVCTTGLNFKRWDPAGLSKGLLQGLGSEAPYECSPVDDSSEADGVSGLVQTGEGAADGATDGFVRR